MTKAKAIETIARNAAEAVTYAETHAIAQDNCWESEQTSYTFDDNSVLVVSGPDFFAKEGASA